MFLLSLVQQAEIPQYGSYSAVIEYQMPYANITEFFMITYDQSSKQQYYEFYNKSGIACDKTFVGGEGNNFYVRTEKDHFNCLNNVGDMVKVLPELSDFKDLGTEYFDLRKMRHFRLQDVYDANTTSDNYLAAETYQQDFWCLPTPNNDKECAPYRWEIRGRSNFDSHQDVYVITYVKFDKVANASVLVKPAECNSPTQNVKSSNSFVHIIHAHATRQTVSKVLDANRKKIAQLQRKHRNFQVAPNRFARLTPEQVRATFTGRRLGDGPSLPICAIDQSISTAALDWRVRGAMTKVKDQASCGSCWTFGVIGVLEARINILKQKESRAQPLLEFSEQHVVDCFWDNEHGVESSNGCEGGSPDMALKWFTEGDKGLAKLLDYPYIGQNDYCKQERAGFKEYKFSNACRLNSVDDIKRALQSGPVSVGVAVSEGFLFYNGGVLDDAQCGSKYEDLGHAVVVIGWGNDQKAGDYWIVRNSWSNYWGQDGYIYISIANNICGVTTDAVMVDVTKV